MSRLLTLLLFLAVISSASDCLAQRGRMFQRAFAPTFSPANTHTSHSQHDPLNYARPSNVRTQPFSQTASLEQNVFELGRYSTYRNPFVSRILDGPTTPGRRDPLEVQSRYIGGFHQNHFDNIGIPSGDIGIRGNAYRWKTW